MFKFIVVTLALCCLRAVAQRACKIDLVLVVDRSGSIGKDAPYGNPENWNQVTSFLGNLVENLELGDDGAQVALVTFSEKAELQFNLTQYGEDNKTNLVSALRQLYYDFRSGGRTNTQAGLTMTSQVLARGQGEREDAPNIVILITDGKPTPSLNRGLNSSVDLLKYGRGARVIAVGVTPQVGESLSYIVTDPDTDYFAVDDFFGLQGRVQQITDEACESSDVCPEEGYVFSAHTRSDRDVSLRKDMLIPFDVTPIDTGGVFDTSQAIFVCPLDGLYRFTFAMSGIYFEFGAAITKQDIPISSLAYVNPPPQAPDSTTDVTASYSTSTDVITHCLRGESVGVKIFELTSSLVQLEPILDGISLTSFTGQYLSPMKQDAERQETSQFVERK